MAEGKTVNVNVRIQQDIKQQAEAILYRIGLPRSVAIDMFYRQIIMHNGVPFPLTIPFDIPSGDRLTESDLDTMLLNGYQQAITDDSFDFDEVFDGLEKDL